MRKITKKDLSEVDGFRYYEDESSNFGPAFLFMKRQERIAIINFYVFCSYIDDIVDSEIREDNTLERKQELIKFWHRKIGVIYSGAELHPNLEPLKETFLDYHIPRTSPEHVIDGIAVDLTQKRIGTFEDLLIYCFGVASIVGITCLYFFGDTSENARNYAEQLGYALQITNIMRDVGEDAARGYIYIPKTLLEKYKVGEEELIQGIYSERFRHLMIEMDCEAKKRYNYSECYLAKCADPKKMRPAQIMKSVYQDLLSQIRKNNYNVFEKRINPSKPQKLISVLKGMNDF